MTTPSLQQKLDRIHEKLNRQIPAEAQALMNANTQNLIDSNQASKARQQGDQIPFFALANQDGQQVSISDLFKPRLTRDIVFQRLLVTLLCRRAGSSERSPCGSP